MCPPDNTDPEQFDVTFPEKPEDLTPGWMSWAFERRFPGTVVESVEVVDINAATATKVRVRLQYNQAGQKYGLPETVIVKGPFGRNVDDMEHTFTDEMRGYKYVVSDIGINTPVCYFAEKQNKNPVMILEDLATPDCVFGQPRRTLSFSEAQSILDLLAKLHATYWQSPELADGGKFDWVLKSISGWHLAYMDMVLEPENWSFYLGLPRGTALPQALASDPVRLKNALYRQIAFYGTGPLTLGHGDAHTANIYFNSKGGGLLDWEMRRCPWYHDVTYFLITSLDVVDRRNWVGALLQYYLDRLAGYGAPAPDFEAAFYCFRRELIYGYILFITNGDGQQFWSEAMNAAVTVRYAMAAEDYDMMSAIEREF
jgi:Ecdysteroid kinase-like family